MASMISSSLHCLTLVLVLTQLAHSFTVPTPNRDLEHKPQPSNAYIVYADHLSKPSHFATLKHWYNSMVASISPQETKSSRILYTYDTVMHGFAAELTDDEARRLSNTPGVAGVYEDRVVHLQTTRSPGYLGLNRDSGIWPDTDFGDGVIIGIIDSGIWPESASFNESGLGPVRPTWKGTCVGGERFNASLCNNKLVGAKVFTLSAEARQQDIGLLSPRDNNGHGTHVASTAAGSAVPDASFFMFSRGTARGVAPKAKMAMYKACSSRGCHTVDIVAAVDAAVKDGVDIISMSLGGAEFDFYANPIAIALFGAMRNGIFIACAAGNEGPGESTLSNVAPWITTVGAANVDRLFPVSVTLGSGEVLTGQSLYAMTANQTGLTPLLLSDCVDLGPDEIMGKVVVCIDAVVADGMAVQRAGGSGLVSLNFADWLLDGLPLFPFTLPAVSLSYIEAEKLMAYIHSVPYPVVSFRFTCDTVIGKNRAPMVVSFSSRGPNHVVPEILKPDVIAPGLNILAAWPNETVLADADDDPRRSSFNIVSGTSISCPHVAGLAALLKHKHHDWTPAMIRSALMTTAGTLDNSGRAIMDNGANGTSATPLAAGAGHVQPQLALDPGLVYDAVEQDYVDFLCTLNYTAEQIRLFVPGFVNCTRTLPGGPGDLNYPSFVVIFNSNNDVRVLSRTVTNVSEQPEAYNVKVVAPNRVDVTVTPASLGFSKQDEKKSYKVVFRSKSDGGHGTAQMEFGHIVWESKAHRVRSPVVFIWKN